MYPSAYVAFLLHFHTDRDYFECHEILEEYWKSLPPDKRTSTWVCLIQVAVALYHHRRGNFNGATKLLQNASSLAISNKAELHHLGLDVNLFTQLLQERLQSVLAKEPYVSLNLPLADKGLLKQCRELANHRGLTFGSVDIPADEYLVHKHTLRDRNEVIMERQLSLTQKKRQNK
ncbi:DUF309 domain-containing protein [Brevibacillus laterosporus]|uniref:DUF309 domain-containing protein n=1 Tax=Brevibacillus laterosporus TaxID=1465 RepID=UPI002650994D|nr:DUF309 domain-containing protein [Brevibacillus laterosporus]MDN9010413.1 DUF309 domain-containing protein [Brevibacillus laterosporus]MDO0941300.1 DUF309 domain-containing protein [Brevibacillus laterosporus]